MTVGKLGRRPPKNAPALQLGRLLTGVAIPPHPAAADHFAKVPSWILGGNDQYGDCGPVSVANQRLLVSTYLGSAPQRVDQAAIFDLYRRSGNPGFDPADPGGPGDGGVDMQTMLEAVLSGGIGGTKALAFAKVDVSSIDELEAAVDIFGSLLLGINLDVAQQTQTDTGTWDYTAGSPAWGGHAVLEGRYSDSPDVGAVISWAQVVNFTDAFESRQIEEAWVVVWPEHLGTTQFEQAIGKAALAEAFTALTGRPFPGAAPAPAPTPTPTPPPAQRSFWQWLIAWIESWFGS